MLEQAEQNANAVALTALGLTPVDVYAGAGAAMTAWASAHPEKVEAAMDFVQGVAMKTTPPQTIPGAVGYAVGELIDALD